MTHGAMIKLEELSLSHVLCQHAMMVCTAIMCLQCANPVHHGPPWNQDRTSEQAGAAE